MSDEKKPVGNLDKMRQALKNKPTPVQTPCPKCGLPMRMFANGKGEPRCGNRNCTNFQGTIALKKLKAEAAKVAEVAAAATPEVPKKPKNNYRTAKARDVRTKAHGRLPVNVKFIVKWNGKIWEGSMFLQTVPPGVENYMGGDIVNDHEYMEATVPDLVRVFVHEADGLFRLMEELDVMFWEWLAKHATAEEKSRLTFAPDPPSPAPWVNPSPQEGTATGSH